MCRLHRPTPRIGGLKSTGWGPRHAQGVDTTEAYMESCLNVAFERPASPNVRQARMSKTAEWDLLSKHKPLRAMVIIAVREEEPPAAEDDDGPARPAMTRARGRTRRSGRNAGPPHMSWLPSPAEVIEEAPYSVAFQLATLLVHKQLDADNWDEAWNVTEQSLRASCLADGVDPVWHLIGEKTPLLAQFLAFPKTKRAEATAAASLDPSLLRFDPTDADALGRLLSAAVDAAPSADAKVALQRVASQVTAGRKVVVDEGLLNLNGALSFVPLHLLLHGGDSVPEAVWNAAQASDAALHDDLLDYARLLTGEVADWNGLLNLDDSDSLNAARLLLAWQHAPDEAEQLSSEALTKGLERLSAADVALQDDRLVWWRLNAFRREGATTEAIEVLLSLSLDGGSDVEALLPVIVDLNDEQADAWLHHHLDTLEDEACLSVLLHDTLNPTLRLTAAQRLSDSGGDAWLSGATVALPLLANALDLERLAQVFIANASLAAAEPHFALLVAHLAPASMHAAWSGPLGIVRRQAIQAIHGADLPDAFSPLSEHLLLLMEGIYKETPELAEVLNLPALRAFSPISRALTGDGVVNTTALRNLEKQLDELDLDAIEHRLFEVILLTLRMNGFIQEHQIGRAKGDLVAQINSTVQHPALPLRLIDSFSFLVLEHDLGLPHLVEWYQHHAPLSSWAPLARAALFAAEGDELNSAREYMRAAEAFSKAGVGESEDNTEDDDSALALPLALYRKSLIHFAHAQHWSEAVDLMERVPALKTAITERFKLYLKVCHTVGTDTDKAMLLIRNHLQTRVPYEDEDDEGNVVVKHRTVYNEEELDLLKNYPFDKAHLLPPEPFLGRVTAAATRISRDLRRSRKEHEQHFRQAMHGSSPSMSEIYEIAKNAAETSPFEGLMYLERAQNTTKFTLPDRRRLAGVESTLFAQHKDDIPTKKRRFLRNLPLYPLVIVDTNVLVDALVDKVHQQLKLVSGTNTDVMSMNRFHRILLHHAKADQLHLMIPIDVRGELKQFAKDQRLRYRFHGAMVDQAALDHALSEDVMLSLVKQVLDEYTTWEASPDVLADMRDVSEELHAFLKRHEDVFDDLTEVKNARGITYRTTLDERAIYPEETDLDIYRLAMHLSEQALPNIGCILVATMDGDFTLLDRAIEERFGFSVTKNHRTLKSWLRL